MNWYAKYLSVFEKPFASTPQSTILEIRDKLDQIQSPEPVASVVVIAHNEEQRLLGCLWSLSENITSYPIDIIGVNNNSSDNTSAVFDLVGITYFFEERKSPGFARDCGQIHAKGKYYICIDSDTLYPSDYFQIMLDNLTKSDVAGVFSLWSFVPDKKLPAWELSVYEFLRDISLLLQSVKRPELCVRGMVFAYNIEYGRKVGYKHDIRRGEDGAMAFGLKKYGRLIFIRNRKARAITCNSSLKAENGLFNALKKRILKAFIQIEGYFVKKDFYKDKKSNLIK